METVSNQQIESSALADWRKLAQALHARYRAENPAAAARFITEIAASLGADARMPDVRLAGAIVDLAVCTREQGLWVTPDDLDLARRISELAARHGLTAQPAQVTQLELALDAADQDAVAPFWSALLTGSPDNVVHDSIFDPTSRVPSVWFQRTDPAATPRQRWHFDLWLAPEVADERIAAAVAAGGTVVDDDRAPAFTVLADPDGNRVCVCTSLDRD